MAESIFAPDSVNGCTVPDVSSIPTCHVIDFPTCVPGVNVCVYGPVPVVTTDPRMCLNRVAMVKFGNSIDTDAPTVRAPRRPRLRVRRPARMPDERR